MKRMPKATGTVLWNIIAPVMLPSARVSLPSLIQKMELNFSGSSVARGASIRAMRPAGNPRPAAACSTASTKKCAPATMTPRLARVWKATAKCGGSCAAGLEASSVLPRDVAGDIAFV